MGRVGSLLRTNARAAETRGDARGAAEADKRADAKPEFEQLSRAHRSKGGDFPLVPVHLVCHRREEKGRRRTGHAATQGGGARDQEDAPLVTAILVTAVWHGCAGESTAAGSERAVGARAGMVMQQGG